VDQTPERNVYLIITDISGYTSFMLAHRTALNNIDGFDSEAKMVLEKYFDGPRWPLMAEVNRRKRLERQ